MNTCGWVDGLGSEIQRQIYDIVEPNYLINMNKFQKNENSEFVQTLLDDQRKNAISQNRLTVEIIQV